MWKDQHKHVTNTDTVTATLVPSFCHVDIFNKHVETIHEGVCYTCSQWDYKATTTPNLKRHVEAINELVCYSCQLSQCNGSNNKRLGNEETETNKYIKIVFVSAWAGIMFTFTIMLILRWKAQ